MPIWNNWKEYVDKKLQSIGGGGTADVMKVASDADLPSDASEGDIAVVFATDTIWVFDGQTNRWIDSGVSGGGTGTTYDDTELRNLINQKANTTHTHSEYALTSHIHPTYENQINSLNILIAGLSNGMTFKSEVATFASIDSTYPTKLKGDTYVVTADETKSGNRTMYVWDGSALAYLGTFGVSAGDKVLDGSTNGQILVNGNPVTVYDDSAVQTALSGKSNTGHTHSEYALSTELANKEPKIEVVTALPTAQANKKVLFQNKLHYADQIVKTQTNIVPKQTSTTSTGGVTIIRSSEVASLPAWKAFNEDQSGSGDVFHFLTTPTPHFVGVIFGSQTKVWGYSVSSQDGTATTPRPKSWILQGSNDTTTGTDGTWTNLQTITAQNFAQNEKKVYDIGTVENYKAYRLYDFKSSDSQPGIAEIEFFGATWGWVETQASSSETYDDTEVRNLIDNKEDKIVVVDTLPLTVTANKKVIYKNGIYKGNAGSYGVTDITPTLTSATSDANFEVNQSSAYGNNPGSYGAWKVFEGLNSSTAHSWISVAGTTHWLLFGWKDGVKRAVSGYSISSQAGGGSQYRPTGWVFQGSNDKTTWTDIETRSGVNFTAAGQKLSFTLTTPVAYTHYRLYNITDASAGSPSIGEMEVFGGTVPEWVKVVGGEPITRSDISVTYTAVTTPTYQEWYLLNFNSIVKDTKNEYANGVVTIKESGFYQINFQLGGVNFVAGDKVSVRLTVGAKQFRMIETYAQGTAIGVNGSKGVYLNAGEIIKLEAWYISTTGQVVAGEGSTSLQVIQVQSV
jgi:hypothetical protein